ncbi:hypothetical protein T492DRAFT_1028197, partial [Pavlovales sp. CCMP2436]
MVDTSHAEGAAREPHPGRRVPGAQPEPVEYPDRHPLQRWMVAAHVEKQMTGKAVGWARKLPKMFMAPTKDAALRARRSSAPPNLADHNLERRGPRPGEGRAGPGRGCTFERTTPVSVASPPLLPTPPGAGATNWLVQHSLMKQWRTARIEQLEQQLEEYAKLHAMQARCAALRRTSPGIVPTARSALINRRARRSSFSRIAYGKQGSRSYRASTLAKRSCRRRTRPSSRSRRAGTKSSASATRPSRSATSSTATSPTCARACAGSSTCCTRACTLASSGAWPRPRSRRSASSCSARPSPRFAFACGRRSSRDRRPLPSRTSRCSWQRGECACRTWSSSRRGKVRAAPSTALG